MKPARAGLPVAARSVVKILRARGYEALGSERFSSPALFEIDRRLLDQLPARPGTFLEIGANDGYSQSNTYYLERRRGWRGVLIEPLPSLYRLCRLHRRRSQCFNVACVAEGGPDTVELLDQGLMSVALDLDAAPSGRPAPDAEEARAQAATRRIVRVPARTLSSVIDESGIGGLDLMVVDVEGVELQVLAGLDLERHAPSLLVVETAHPEKVDALLGPAMTRSGQLTPHDYLYSAA